MGQEKQMKECEEMEQKKTGNACGFHCIQMQHITVKDGSQVLLDDVNLHIHCGKITAIIGKNGAGKSTLMKAIVGERKHEGTITFTNHQNKTIQKLRMGYMPQHLKLDKNIPISVYDLFAGFISNRPVFLPKSKKLYQQIQQFLSIFDAKELIDKRVCDLSGGELQRVLLAIAITPVPNLLLLDEPVSGIDQKGMDLFYQNICYLKENYDLAMIIVSHDFDFVRKYADYVILLDQKIACEGTPEEVLESKEFKERFGEIPIEPNEVSEEA